MSPAEEFQEFLDGAVDFVMWATSPTPEETAGDSVGFTEEYEFAEGQLQLLRTVVASAARRFFVSWYVELRSASQVAEWDDLGHRFARAMEGMESCFDDWDMPEVEVELLESDAREYEGTLQVYLESGMVHVEPGGITALDEGLSVEVVEALLVLRKVRWLYEAADGRRRLEGEWEEVTGGW